MSSHDQQPLPVSASAPLMGGSVPDAPAAVQTSPVAPSLPPTETDSTAERSTDAGHADAPEPKRKRVRADGPLPADAFGEAHGRPHAEKTRKTRDVYGEAALQDMAARPETFGDAGRKIRLFANMFDVSIDLVAAARPILHYDVDFIIPLREAGEVGKQKKMNRVQAWELWQELGPSNPEIAHIFEAAAFDGLKNCFAPFRIPLKSNSKTDAAYDEKLNEGHLQVVFKEGKRTRDLWISFGLVRSQSAEDAILPVNLLRFCDPSGAHDQDAVKASKKSPLVIQALDILLRHDVHRRFPITSGQGRKFFAPGVNTTGLNKGGELMRGIFQSLRPTLAGPKLIMDAPYSAWVAGGRLDLVAAALVGKGGNGGGGGGRGGFGGRGRCGYGGSGGGGYGGGGGGGDLDERDWRVVMKYLKKARVTLKHRDAGVFQILGITREGASQRRFTLEHRVRRGEPEPDPPIPAREISVADYFAEMLNIQLEKPHAPCVEIRGRQLVPIELVQLLPGQPIPFLLTSPEQTSETIKQAGKPPNERRAEILQARQQASYHDEAVPDGGGRRLAAWGVMVDREMTKVLGRILPPPRVILANGPASVRNGKFNLINARFIKPNTPLKSWAILNFGSVSDLDIQDFVQTLVQAGSAAGMSFVERFPRIIKAGPDIKNSLKAAGKSAIMRSEEQFGEKIPPQLVLCIVPDRYPAESRSIYEAIKRIAIMDLPIPLITQCMKESKVRQTRPNAALQYCGNLSTKINLKLSGRNWTVDTPAAPGTIIFGADIAHAAPGSRGASRVLPVASVVAATDGTLSDWKAQIRSQDAGVECIAGLDEMVLHHLHNYEATAGHAPKSLVFYRDGVSEGEFKQVVEVEVAGVKAACERFAPGVSFPVTYIICGKRHKTRLFASKEDSHMCDRNGNLPAGTVVDRTITSPLVFDFYLQAHSGLLGTAKPTHYHVLVDENGFQQDSVQSLTNSLCWLFGRATMGVSIVTPAYLADIACEKARLLIAPDFDDASTVTSNSNEAPALYLDPLKIQNALNRGQGVANGWFI